jgi:serine/threonine protein kinase
MLRERWQEVERLYYLALERDPALRSAFLGEAAGGDRELLEEVESLLKQPGSDSRLNRPVWQSSAAVRARFGSYEIETLLGAGDMGEVFRAHDRRLKRQVAIKVSKQPFTRRFKHEARAVAALSHPNIVQIYELGSCDGEDYIAMEFVPGRTLAQLIREKRLGIDEALAWAHQIASALAAAHIAGIVHRDIKPGNIIVNDASVAKILDFGLAKYDQSDEPGDNTTGTAPVTENGETVGTPS